MGYDFEWGPAKATANLRKHRVEFEEACTVFADPLGLLMRDPDHSLTEERYIVLGLSVRRRMLVVAFAERGPRTRLISARRATPRERGAMKKSRATNDAHPDDGEDRDTMRPEYDFSGAVRGQTVVRYAQGVNIAVVDPEVMDVFPDSAAVNKALRALAPLLREQRKQVGRSHRRGDPHA